MTTWRCSWPSCCPTAKPEVCFRWDGKEQEHVLAASAYLTQEFCMPNTILQLVVDHAFSLPFLFLLACWVIKDLLWAGCWYIKIKPTPRYNQGVARHYQQFALRFGSALRQQPSHPTARMLPAL